MEENEIRKIIGDYTQSRILSIRRIENGLVNHVHIVTTDKDSLVVRIDPDESTLNRFRKEIFCAEVALRNGVKTPQVYKIGIHEDHPYMLMQYIEGIDGNNHPDQSKIWESLGNYARKIHKIEVGGYGENYLGENEFDDQWERFLGYNIDSLNSQDKVLLLGILSGSQQEEILSIFQQLSSTDINIGLCHHDLSPKNTIVNYGGDVFLIDWGSATVGPCPHLDLIEILDSSLEKNSVEFNLFLDAYGMSRTDFRKIEENLKFIDLLESMDKLRWAIDRKPEKIGEFGKRVKNKLLLI